MKNGIMLLMLVGILTACSTVNETNPEIKTVIGKWKLTEQLADPGDGSSVFKSVNSEKTIEFLADGTVVSNGSLCTMNTNTGNESSGKYYSSGNYIQPDGCNLNNFRIGYALENSKLILSYPCIEGCGQKFVKVD